MYHAPAHMQAQRRYFHCPVENPCLKNPTEAMKKITPQETKKITLLSQESLESNRKCCSLALLPQTPGGFSGSHFQYTVRHCGETSREIFTAGNMTRSATKRSSAHAERRIFDLAEQFYPRPSNSRMFIESSSATRAPKWRTKRQKARRCREVGPSQRSQTKRRPPREEGNFSFVRGARRLLAQSARTSANSSRRLP